MTDILATTTEELCTNTEFSVNTITQFESILHITRATLFANSSILFFKIFLNNTTLI